MLSSTILYAFLLAFPSAAKGQLDASRFAWYTSPAADFASSVPIGNGRVAGTVWGGASELVSLNENSIWSGPWRSRANPKALGALPSIRSLLSSGNLTAAGQSVLANMASSPTSPQGYQPLGNLSLEFGHSSSGMSSYTRYLDTYEGTAFVTYNYGGVNYT